VEVAVEEEGELRDAVVESDIAFVGIERDTYLVVGDVCFPISPLFGNSSLKAIFVDRLFPGVASGYNFVVQRLACHQKLDAKVSG